MPETGYGSDPFLRACQVAPACRQIEGRRPRAVWGRLRAGSLHLSRYERQLPATQVRLTDAPAGRMIAEHFDIRERGDWRFRRAQGVLVLPADFADYLRGRHRQAVRTNVAHARRAGFTVLSYAVDNWVPGIGDTRRGHISPGPVERWMVIDDDGVVVADSILSIDAEVAFLQGLVSFATNARWLLHTAIVERLCGSCQILLTNSDDVYLLSLGNQHFQRLLGYRISRLRISRSKRPAPETRPQPAGMCWPPEIPLSCGILAPVAAPALEPAPS
jgi:hypothetical protein